MPFVKGQSGNPGGRPKVVKELQALARTHTEEAVNRLVYWMRQKADASAALKAIDILLQRGHGKPVSVSSVEHKGQVEQKITVSDTELARQAAFLLAKEVFEKKEEDKTLQ